jgi:hypothetical protein
MRSRNKLVFVFLLIALVLALPSAALANKLIYRAKLSTGAELHEVVGSNASGTAVFARFPDSVRVNMSVRGLSGVPTAAHIHMPAGEDGTAGPVVTLCGAPAPAVFGSCSDYATQQADGTYLLAFQEGVISGGYVQGITAAQFFNFLDQGLGYVNVHTALNPAGETRGQIIPQ